VAGIRTRRYHGLLVAALDAPLGRTVMATDVHEGLTVGDVDTPLHASRWWDDSVSPRGFAHTEAFWLEGQVPVWRFAIGAVCLEKRVVMEPGRDVTVLRYRLVRAAAPVRLTLKLLATYRDFHATTRGDGWSMDVAASGADVVVTAFPGARPLRVSGDGLSLAPAHTWYEGFSLGRERDRGLDSRDDALHVVTASGELAVGDEVTLLLSAAAGDVDAATALARAARHEADVLARYGQAQGAQADAVGARLALAADQFVVRRDVAGHRGATVIAGYPWFGDWGRDTMIALPGLALSAGRPELMRDVLVTYARFVDRGMLPNRFPDAGGAPEYNTVDATLWFIEAVRAYVAATGDLALAGELWPVLDAIVTEHEAGTRFGIGVDPDDGLLRSGEAGVQLTWMDAKVGDWVVTPRTGKCVEINALWFNGLVALAELAAELGRDAAPWRARAARVEVGMERFWCAAAGHLYDVLDGPAGDDASLRPNQIFAVSLAASAFAPERQRAVVDACARALLTSHGLRSLAPDDPAYRPRYGGDPLARDGAYHQGTVWGWLLGPYALAHHRVYGDAAAARALLEPLVDHLGAHGVGSIAEIFDGAPPHLPRGCPAQAWSVAETLRAWTTLAPTPEDS
jgi:predicted glycogen debranching enzyme